MKHPLKLLALLAPSLVFCQAQEPSSLKNGCSCDKTFDGRSYFLSVDYLYWYAKQEGNSYAVTGASQTVPGTLDPNTGLTPPGISSAGKVYSPKGKMQSGFKVGAGVECDVTYWTLAAEYTYFRNKSSSTIASYDLNTGILPLFSYTPNNSILSLANYNTSIGAQGFVSKASSFWSLKYNLLTLELSKKIDILNDAFLVPHFGLEGAQQTQHFNTFYAVNALDSINLQIGSNSVYFLQKLYGIGPRFGLDLDWRFSKHFGTFIQTGCSMLWSYFNANARSYDTNTLEDYAGVLIANHNYKPHSLTPMCQFILGLESNWTFKDSYEFLVQAGWENQFWFFQNQHASAIANTSLILQGLTLAFKFSF